MKYLTALGLVGTLVLPIGNSIEQPRRQLTYNDKAQMVAADVIENGDVTREFVSFIFPMDFASKIPGLDRLRKRKPSLVQKTYIIDGEKYVAEISFTYSGRFLRLSLINQAGFEMNDHLIDGNVDSVMGTVPYQNPTKTDKDEYKRLLDELIGRNRHE